MTSETERVLKRIREEEFKLTQQRRLIVELFIEHENIHPSAEELYQLVMQEEPDVGLATVYRTLDLLERLGVVHTVNFGDGKARYELTSELHQHHHLLCKQCGAVDEVDEDLLGAVEQELTKRTGYSIIDHEVKFYGLCPSCQTEQEDV